MTHILKIIDSISMPGNSKITNQDYIDFNAQCVLLLDGATPLEDKQLYPVEQFVRNFSEIFFNKFNNEDEVLSLVTETCQKLTAAKSIPIENFPSASSIILTVYNRKLKLTQVGDCKAYIYDGNSIKVAFPTTRIEQLDLIALNMMEGYQNLGFSVEKSKEMVKPTLLAHRKLKNAKEGYPSLSVGLSNALDLINQVQIDLSNNHQYKILLASDGFYNGFESYQPETLELIFSRELSLKDALSGYREIEALDSGLTNFPRFKPSDDATAVLLALD